MRRVQIQVFHCHILKYTDFLKELERYNWEIVRAKLIEGKREEIRFICERSLVC